MRHRVEQLLLWLVRSAVRLLPRRAALDLGARFGRLAFTLDRRHREIALANFVAAFPAANREEAERTVREAFAFFGRYLFDLLTCMPAFPAARMSEFEHEGLERVEAAYRAGKGILFFTGHWGGWELMAAAHGLRGRPVGVIARRLDNPHLDRLLRAFRTSTGNFVIDKHEGLRPMLKALRGGKGIAMLIDQNVTGEERVFVDFFGRPASTTPALALLHLRTGAALMPVFALPLAGGRYRFVHGPPVEVEATGDREQDRLRVTQACTRVLEDAIRRYPSYWLWMHRRWKTRPAPAEVGAVGAESAPARGLP